MKVIADVGMVIKAMPYYLDQRASRPYKHEAAAAIASVRKGSKLAQHWVSILAVIQSSCPKIIRSMLYCCLSKQSAERH